MECLFCKIGNKIMESEVVYEDNETLAFLDINPVAPGHTLVIPRKHSENILDSEFNILNELFGTVKIVTDMIQKSLNPHGFNIGINHGKNAGQAIDHMHVHIIPRFEGDGGGSMHTIVRNPPKQQTVEEIGGLIRSQPHDEKPEEAPKQVQEPKVDEKEIEEILNNAKKEVEEHHKRDWEQRKTP